MLIEEYFVRLEQTFASCPHVVQTTLTKDKRAPHSGFVKGTVVFSQGIQLFIMEFVRTEPPCTMFARRGKRTEGNKTAVRVRRHQE